MFCNECGNKLDVNAKFCDKCGAKVGSDATTSNDSNEVSEKVETISNNVNASTNVNNSTKTSNHEQTKAYQILSYLGILWLVGLLSGYKDDEDVKFHVGQGMILTIVMFVASLIVGIINQVIIFSIFKEEKTFLGYGLGVYEVSKTGITISVILYGLVSVFSLAMMIIGIKNVLDKNKKQLPIIGKFAFYK